MPDGLSILMGEIPSDIETNVESYKRTELITFLSRPDIKEKLREKTKWRVSHVRRILGWNEITTDDVESILDSAIAFGYYRALINRFSEDYGLDRNWWIEHRRKVGATAKDRTYDFEIIAEQYPDFLDYYPEIPLSDKDVLDAAADEFHDQFAGRGSDYLQYRYGTMFRFEVDGQSAIPYRALDNHRPTGRYQNALILTDEETTREIEQFERQKMQSDASHPLGPAMTRALEVALKELGTAGLYWLLIKTVYDGQISKMYRALGKTEEEMGEMAFKAATRQMSRKYGAMDALMTEKLKADPVMQQLHEYMWDDDEGPAPESREAEANPLADAERDKYFSALWDTCIDWVRTESRREEYADLLQDMEVDMDILQAFNEVRAGVLPKWRFYRRMDDKLTP